MFEKKLFKKWIGIFLLAIVVALITYFNRWIFFYRFEPDYWENYYYESQWNVANSKRVISDEGVYRYIGYRLVNGENPFNVDYWVPPLGKYWYGFGAKYLGNPYLISYFYYLVSILVFGIISKKIFSDRKIVFLSTLLFVINPLLVEQIGQTMLDLPMTLFFMLTILMAIKAIERKKIIYVIFSGIFLGLMAGVKPPYFIPMIGLICGWWFFKNKIGKWWYFFFFVGVGYLLAYTCYFWQHPNPIPFVRLHQKIIDFQKNNGGNHDLLNILRVIFLDRYKGHWLGAETIKPENWSIALPLGTLSLFWIGIKNKLFIKNKEPMGLICVLGICYLAMVLTIDFWPRYLMPMIPIFTLLLVYLFKKHYVWLFFVVGLTGISLKNLLFPLPNQFWENFQSVNKNGFCKESYRMLDTDSKQKIKENDWCLSVAPDLDTTQTVTRKENNQWKIRLLD